MPAPAPVAPGTIRDDLIVEDEPRLAELVRAARRWLPKYALPEHVVPLLRFPLKGSESRKLDKDVLPPPRGVLFDARCAQVSTETDMFWELRRRRRAVLFGQTRRRARVTNKTARGSRECPGKQNRTRRVERRRAAGEARGSGGGGAAAWEKNGSRPGKRRPAELGGETAAATAAGLGRAPHGPCLTL